MRGLSKAIGVAVAVVVVVLALAAAYFVFAPGTLEVYVQDPPQQQLAIYITFTSLALHKVNASGNPWVVIFNGSKTIALSSTPQLLATASVPPGQYNEVFFTISSATVEISGVNITARIPSAVFKVHITGGMRISPGSTVKLLISFPHISFANGQVIISPSITAEVIS